ncbi:hypothetical protein BJV77DRAFT_690098 [Russula vinacea]|nr:hypothetical protein BJV77DRAFT_690098 [Russula vinacea]
MGFPSSPFLSAHLILLFPGMNQELRVLQGTQPGVPLSMLVVVSSRSHGDSRVPLSYPPRCDRLFVFFVSSYQHSPCLLELTFDVGGTHGRGHHMGMMDTR